MVEIDIIELLKFYDEKIQPNASSNRVRSLFLICQNTRLDPCLLLLHNLSSILV